MTGPACAVGSLFSRSAMPRRVAVIGAGPIGAATAAWLARQGKQVLLHDVDAARIEPLRQRGAVRVEGPVISGDFPIWRASTDLADILPGVDLVILAVPASAHEAVARAAAPHLQDGAIVMIQPGATLSALAFTHALAQAAFQGHVTPVETLNALFICRPGSEPGAVALLAVKHNVKFAALPAWRTSAMGSILRPLFDFLVPAGSTLEVSLQNPNGTLHPVVTLLNAGQIDRGERFLYYTQGSTPYAIHMVEAVDAERVAIAQAYGVPWRSVQQWYQDVYGIFEPDLYHTLQAMEPYRTITAPPSMQTRLILEDIPTGMVAFASLAQAVGLDVPLMRAFVHICGVIYGRDFWAEGRSLQRYGYGHLDREGVIGLLGPER